MAELGVPDPINPDHKSQRINSHLHVQYIPQELLEWQAEIYSYPEHVWIQEELHLLQPCDWITHFLKCAALLGIIIDGDLNMEDFCTVAVEMTKRLKMLRNRTGVPDAVRYQPCGKLILPANIFGE